MENYRRYDSSDEKKYNKRGLSYLMMRKKADKFIVPYLKNTCNKTVLEVGIGYGYYKDVYFSKNVVTGYDVNTDMGQKLGIEIISGRADEIEKVNRKFDRIYSFYMTEYLNHDELKKFINQSVDSLLNEGGIFATTVIVNRGLGLIYTKLATMKGIKKYSYSYDEIRELVKGRQYRIVPMKTYFGLPMSMLLEIEK